MPVAWPLSKAICSAYWPTSVTSRIFSSSGFSELTRDRRPAMPASPRHSAQGQAQRSCSPVYVPRAPSSHSISITWRARSTSTLVGNGSGSCVVSVLVNVDDGQLAKRLDRRPRGDLGSDLDERPGARGLGSRDDDGCPAVRVLADSLLEGDRAEEGNAEALGGRLGAAVAEDLVPVAAAWADVPAHVLDQAERRHVEPAEHLQGLDRDFGRDI